MPHAHQGSPPRRPAHDRRLANLAAAHLHHKSIQTPETMQRCFSLRSGSSPSPSCGTLHAVVGCLGIISDKGVVHELLPPRSRPRGPTVRAANAHHNTWLLKGDNAPMAVIELVLRARQPRSRRQLEKSALVPPSTGREEGRRDSAQRAAIRRKRRGIVAETPGADPNYAATVEAARLAKPTPPVRRLPIRPVAELEARHRRKSI